MTVEIKINDEWVSCEVVGKRRGYIRVQFADEKTKWVELARSEVRGYDPAGPATPKQVATPADPEEVAPEQGGGDGAEEAFEPADPEVSAQLTEVTRGMNYQQQGAFFLNAYWREYSADAETIWEYSLAMAALDQKDGADGNCLDEHNARRFMQDLGMAMARQAYLDAMRQIDVNNDRKMSLLEFLLFKYGLSPADLVARPQDGMTDALENALAREVAAYQAIADLDAEKAELEEVANSGGVKAMRAKQQLANFKTEEYRAAEHEVNQAKRAVTKARKDPELREKGTEWFMERGGEHARPKKAVKANTMVDQDGTYDGDSNL